MALFGEFDPTVDPTHLGWFDSSLAPSEWFDPTCGPVVVSILTSRSLVGGFDTKQAVVCLFDECASPSRWFDPITGPDDFPTLTALGLSIFAASPYAGSPLYNFGSAGTSTTRALVFRSAIPAPTVGATVNGRASAYYDSTATGAFNPLTIAGCAVWYDLEVNTNAAGVVTAIPDQSGNARDAVIAAGSEPTHTTTWTTPGGFFEAMTFPAVDTKHVVAPNLGITTGARTFVLVCDFGAGGDTFALGSGAGPLFLRGVATAPVSIQVSGDTATNYVEADCPTTTPAVIVWVDNGASTKVYVSALTPSGVMTGTEVTADLTGDTLMLGNYPPGLNTSDGQNGSTAQFLVYNSALSSTDVAYLLNGFGAKYGIAIGP